MRGKTVIGALFLALPVLAIVGTVMAASPAQSVGGRPESPSPRFSYSVVIEGEDVGRFTAVDGLSIEVEVVEFRDGSDPLIRKLPGRVKYGDITLKRGYVASSDLNDWIETARLGEGAFTRKNMSIILHDNSTPGAPSEVKRWNLFETFPKQWKLSTLDGKGNDVLTEELVIVIEWFEEA